MNPFLNPTFLLKFFKGYLLDISRLHRFSNEQIKEYQNKQIKKMVEQAFTVPMYSTIYKKNGIKKSDIQTINDLKNLPIIKKEDFTKFKPEELIPSSKQLTDYVKVSTSGTTGKSLAIYVNLYEILIGLFGYLRTIKDYGISWRKDNISIIGDFAPHTAETGYIKKGLAPNIVFSNLFSTIQWLDTNSKPEKIMKGLEKFKPQFIGGYAGMLGHLAVLKSQGHGKNLKPKIIASTGSLLDSNLKKFIENVFQTKIFEVYGATETGPIAYQCKNKGVYHVMSDFLYLEYIDEKGKPVPSKIPGHLIVTKLYGGGTPIIRYNALNDIVSPLYEKHKCNISGDLIDRIYGRDNKRLYRKDGKIVLASSLTSIFSRLLYELKTSKIRDIKVIQKSFDLIEISVVIDKSLRDIGPSINEIFEIFHKGFKDKFGNSVTIICKEIKEVKRDEPRIITNIDPTQLKITGFL
ncbi:MAG: phenylacetate--CoA ligase family protein [Promethearchaeota archaeon]|jgi:phenylacetate-CoA ligase